MKLSGSGLLVGSGGRGGGGVIGNSAMKSVYSVLSSKQSEEIFDIISNYLTAVKNGLLTIDQDDQKLTQSAVFRAFIAFFIPVASKLKDRFGPDYTVEHFEFITDSVFEKIKLVKLSGNSQVKIFEHLESGLKSEFSL